MPMNVGNPRQGLAVLAALAFAIAAPIAFAPSALADPPAHAGKGDAEPGKAQKQNKDARNVGRHGQGGRYGGRTQMPAAIETGDRFRIQAYFSDSYGERDCPPGLAKKNNGCLPPGQAKQYARGDVVPGGARLIRLPEDLEARLRPLPPGYVYRRADGAVLVVAEAARKVIDIVVLLSTL